MPEPQNTISAVPNIDLPTTDTSMPPHGYFCNDQDFKQNFASYVQDYINEQLILPLSITGDQPGFRHNTLLDWVWYYVTKTPNALPLTLYQYTLNLTEAQLNTTHYVNRYDAFSSTPLDMAGHRISLIYVKKGVQFFNKMQEKYAEYAQSNLSTVLTIERYHKCQVYIRGNHCMIITNRYDNTWLYKLLTLLPAFFKVYQPITTDTELAAFGIIKSIFENDMDSLAHLMAFDLLKYERVQKDATYNNLLRQLANKNRAQIDEAAKNIKYLETRLEEYSRATMELEQQYLNAKALHCGLITTPVKVDEDTLNFIKNNKALELIKCTEQFATWRVTTPILNYNKKDVEMYFKHMDQPNALNKPDWLASLIHLVFIQERYQLVTVSTVAVPWPRPNGTPSWTTNHGSQSTFGNPHIVDYNCFATSKTAIHKALSNGDIVTALNVLVSACSTITFTDSTVVARLATKIKDSHYNIPAFKDIKTGKLYSAKQMRHMFEKVHDEDPPDDIPTLDNTNYERTTT